MKASQLVGRVATRTEPVFLSDDFIDIDHMLPVKILRYSPERGITIVNIDGNRELLSNEWDDDKWEESTNELYETNLNRIYDYTHDHRYIILSEVLEDIDRKLKNGQLEEMGIPKRKDDANKVKFGKAPYVVPRMSVVDACDLIHTYLESHSDSEYVVYFEGKAHSPYSYLIMTTKLDTYGKYYHIEMDLDTSYDPSIIVIDNDIMRSNIERIIRSYGIVEVRSIKHLCGMMASTMMFGIEHFIELSDGEKAVVYSGHMIYLAERSGDTVTIHRGVKREHVGLKIIALEQDEYRTLNAAIADKESVELFMR